MNTVVVYFDQQTGAMHVRAFPCFFIISTSKWCAEQQFAGPNTQHTVLNQIQDSIPYLYSNLATWFLHSSGNGYKASSNINYKCHIGMSCALHIADPGLILAERSLDLKFKI